MASRVVERHNVNAPVRY